MAIEPLQNITPYHHSSRVHEPHNQASVCEQKEREDGEDGEGKEGGESIGSLPFIPKVDHPVLGNKLSKPRLSKLPDFKSPNTVRLHARAYLRVTVFFLEC